ncbi:MAG: cytidine deaminase [Microbacterium sp.]|jgi:cytidine deaminase|uniref:cytidine deaminase n=1 Tax=Microbacterium sp. TaxID=51671 RepID=UPI002615D60D|nr:cytidine deaminase [Microbacterium sp.]MDF2558576.1 cytidine deaminase [Microbacterium sp.]
MTPHLLVDWDNLRRRAIQMLPNAYAPYSNYQVGAAALVDDGRIIVGCNVENRSYGVTLCAECGLVSALHASGGGRLVAFTCVNGSEEVITPCGRCRALLHEHGGPEMLVETDEGVMTLGELYPRP